MVTAKSAKELGLSRPETLLRELIRDYPQAPAAADRFRKALTEPDGMRWPEWCFVPMSAWNAVVMEFGVFPGRSAVDLHIDMSRLHHLMGWRYTKGIYNALYVNLLGPGSSEVLRSAAVLLIGSSRALHGNGMTQGSNAL